MTMRLLGLLFLAVLSTPAKANQYVRYPSSSGNGVATYATAAALPILAADGATAITLDTHAFYIFDLGTVTWVLQTASTGIAGPGTSVDSQIAIFSGTGGNAVKAALGTGVVHATSGVYSVATVTVAEGGTNATTAATARTSLGAAASGANTDITSISGLADGVGDAGGISWPESGNDTRITHPGDGLISIYNNGTFSAQFTPNGLNVLNVPYTWPGSNAAGFLADNGSGSLSWSAVPWETPGTIGSITPNTGNFTTVSANKYISGPGSDPATSGYIFDSDTGLLSSSDGAMELWANNVVGVRFDSNGIREIRAVPMLWPNTQGNPADVLTNDGSGNLTWAPGTSTPSGPNDTFAGFDGTGALTNILGWGWDEATGTSTAGIQVDPDSSSPTMFSFSANINPIADTTANDTGIFIGLNCGTDSSGFDCGDPNTGTGSLTGILSQVNSTNQSDAGFIAPIQGSTNFGNGTDPVTLNQWVGGRFSLNVGSNSTVKTVSGIQISLDAAASTVMGDAHGVIINGNSAQITGNFTGIELSASTQDMPTVNTGWTGLNMGPTVSTGGNKVSALTEISTHPQVLGTVHNDYQGWDAGTSVNHVERNVNFANVHGNYTQVDGNFTGYSSSAHVTTMAGGSYSEMILNGRADSLAYNYSGVSVSPQITEHALAAEDFTVNFVDDVGGNLAGKGITFGLPYTNGGQNYTPWLKVSGSGSAPGCCGTPIEVDVATNDTAATIATAIQAALVAFGAPLTTYMTFTDLGGAVQFVAVNPGPANLVQIDDMIPFGVTRAYTTFGAGGGSAAGLQINMSNAVGFDQDQVHAIDVNGRVGASTNYVLHSVSNAQVVNGISTTFTAPASTTIANSDFFGFAPVMNLNLGHDAVVTSGAFGLGEAASGALLLMQLDDASTVDNVVGNVFAFVPIGGSGAGGVIGTFHGSEIVGLPGAATGSPTLLTNAKGIDLRTPAGPFTTSTAWGIYAESGWDQNFLGSALKIGAGGDTVSGADISLETNKAILDDDAGGNGGNVPHDLTRRSSTSATSATCAVTCSAGEVATGGGCDNTDAANAIQRTLPTANDTWSCTYLSAFSDCTAWAVCMKY